VLRTAGQSFLETLAAFPPNTFESSFYSLSNRLDLGSILDRNEFTLLYEAAFQADLCNDSINSGQDSKTDSLDLLEGKRRKCETDFMIARDIFYASPGWQDLPASRQAIIDQVFLSVSVAAHKFAW
jgi:hypothetical protein